MRFSGSLSAVSRHAFVLNRQPGKIEQTEPASFVFDDRRRDVRICSGIGGLGLHDGFRFDRGAGAWINRSCSIRTLGPTDRYNISCHDIHVAACEGWRFQFPRMGGHVRRRQNGHGPVRPPIPSLPHTWIGERPFAVQGKRSNPQRTKGEASFLDQNMNPRS